MQSKGISTTINIVKPWTLKESVEKSYTMCTRDSPDIYTLRPAALGLCVYM